jgi:1-phosphatidylinositol-4-phosphate 5-kinase
MLISLVGAQKEAREFPGNLILTITTAQLALLIQSYLGGLGTAFVFETPALTSHLHPVSIETTFLLSLIASVFQVAFLFAIVFVYSSITKPRADGMLFWGVPALAVAILFFSNSLMSMEGSQHHDVGIFNRNALLIELDLALMSLVLGVWAWMVLRQFRETRKKRVGIRDDFLSFYHSYTAILVGFNSLQVFSYLCIIWAGPCEGPLNALDGSCVTWLAFAKIGLNWRPLLPFAAVIVNLRDPLTKKLLKIDLKEVEMAQSGVQEKATDDSLFLSRDLVAPTEIQNLQEAMARTLIMGLGEYFRTWADFYDEGSDATILEKVVHVLKHDQINSYRDPEGSFERFGLECEVTSHAAQAFLGVIKAHLILDVPKSFNLAMSQEVVRNSTDRTVHSSLHFSFLTWDRRFHIQSLSDREYRVLKGLAPAYADHITANRFSFLSKMIGLFSFKYISSGQKVRVCVLENIFLEEEAFFRRRYDLKGYQVDRQVLVKPRQELERLKERRIPETLQDTDFVNLDGNFLLRQADQEFLAGNLARDVDFLRERRMMNYSLLVGIVDTEALDQVQLEHFGELSALKLAFFDQNRRHAIVFGVAGFFQQSGRFQALLAAIRGVGSAPSPFHQPQSVDTFARGFLASFDNYFKNSPGEFITMKAD